MTPAFEPYDVAIAGAGISGLACAWAMRRAGLRVIVIEAGDDVGGCIRTIRRDGCIADGGPQTFVASPAFLDLVDSVGLVERLQRPPQGATAPYFFSHGRLVRVPSTPAAFLGSPILSPLAKLRAAVEPLIGAKIDGADESLSDFVARRAGRAVVDALARPMVAGIFGGDPGRISAKSAFPALVDYERRYTSVIVGAVATRLRQRTSRTRRVPMTFSGGNDALPRALAARLAPDVRLETTVDQLILRGANVELAFAGEELGSVVARHAVLALPAYTAGDLLDRLEPEAARALREIPYAPIAQVSLSYPREAVRVPLNGFGFLSGERSGLRILGCTWNSAMFPDRCTPDRTLVTAFLGGATDPQATTMSDDEVVKIVHRDLQRALDIGVSAPSVIAGFKWDRAIPQYEVGHAERLKTIEYGMSRLSQVSLLGNYFTGPSVGDCVAAAHAMAERVSRRLQDSRPM